MDRNGRDMQVFAAKRLVLKPQLSAISGLRVTLHTGGVAGSIPAAPTIEFSMSFQVVETYSISIFR